MENKEEIIRQSKIVALTELSGIRYWYDGTLKNMEAFLSRIFPELSLEEIRESITFASNYLKNR